MARYRKIDPRIWNDEKFRRLNGEEQRIALYILTAQSNRIGLFSFSPGKAIEDLETLPQTFAQGFQKVCQTLKWEWDAGARVVYLPTWWKYNPPESANNIVGNLKDLDDIPTTPLLGRFIANTLYLSDNVKQALDQVLAKRYPNPSPQPFPNPSPTQEQELSRSRAGTKQKQDIVGDGRTEPPAQQDPPSTSKKDKPKFKARIPNDYPFTPDHLRIGIKHGMSEQVARDEFEHFYSHHSGVGNVYADWLMVWSTWVQNWKKGKFSRGGSGPVQRPRIKTSLGNVLDMIDRAEGAS